MHGRFGVGVVADVDGDLGSLRDAQGRAGDRAVVGEHADPVVAELLDDGRDAQVEGVAVVELDDRGSGGVVEAGGVGREGASVGSRGGGGSSMPPTVSGSSGPRSSGIGIGANALTSAPPVLPTG